MQDTSHEMHERFQDTDTIVSQKCILKIRIQDPFSYSPVQVTTILMDTSRKMLIYCLVL